MNRIWPSCSAGVRGGERAARYPTSQGGPRTMVANYAATSGGAEPGTTHRGKSSGDRGQRHEGAPPAWRSALRQPGRLGETQRLCGPASRPGCPVVYFSFSRVSTTVTATYRPTPSPITARLTPYSTRLHPICQPLHAVSPKPFCGDTAARLSATTDLKLTCLKATCGGLGRGERVAVLGFAP